MAVDDRYTYRVTWSAEDQEHVGLCAEFPSLSWLAPTQQEPFSERRFSGRFTVRVPSETHRALTIQAAEEGISLNRLVSAKLSADAVR